MIDESKYNEKLMTELIRITIFYFLMIFVSIPIDFILKVLKLDPLIIPNEFNFGLLSTMFFLITFFTFGHVLSLLSKTKFKHNKIVSIILDYIGLIFVFGNALLLIYLLLLTLMYQPLYIFLFFTILFFSLIFRVIPMESPVESVNSVIITDNYITLQKKDGTQKIYPVSSIKEISIFDKQNCFNIVSDEGVMTYYTETPYELIKKMMDELQGFTKKEKAYFTFYGGPQKNYSSTNDSQKKFGQIAFPKLYPRVDSTYYNQNFSAKVDEFDFFKEAAKPLFILLIILIAGFIIIPQSGYMIKFKQLEEIEKLNSSRTVKLHINEGLQLNIDKEHNNKIMGIKVESISEINIDGNKIIQKEKCANFILTENDIGLFSIEACEGENLKNLLKDYIKDEIVVKEVNIDDKNYENLFVIIEIRKQV